VTETKSADVSTPVAPLEVQAWIKELGRIIEARGSLAESHRMSAEETKYLADPEGHRRYHNNGAKEADDSAKSLRSLVTFLSDTLPGIRINISLAKNEIAHGTYTGNALRDIARCADFLDRALLLIDRARSHPTTKSEGAGHG